MTISLTKDFIGWELFSYPQRVHILIYLLAMADSEGRVEIVPDEISLRTTLLLSTVTKCLEVFVSKGILTTAKGNAILSLPDGITPADSGTLGSDPIVPPQPQPKQSGTLGSDPIVPVEAPTSVRPPAKRFQKPTLEEVQAYVREKGYTFDPEAYMAHYESCGWVIGKNKPMKNWKAACTTFQKNDNKFNPQYIAQNSYERNRNQARAQLFVAEAQRNVAANTAESGDTAISDF